jgi:hypothetical protein
VTQLVEAGGDGLADHPGSENGDAHVSSRSWDR